MLQLTCIIKVDNILSKNEIYINIAIYPHNYHAPSKDGDIYYLSKIHFS